MLFHLSVLFRTVLGLLLVITGILKIPDRKGFFVILVEYDLFPVWFARLSSVLLPWGELVIGTWLLLRVSPLYSVALALLYLTSTSLITLFALLKGKRISNCGCYGTAIKSPLTWLKFCENVIWVLMALVVMYASL